MQKIEDDRIQEVIDLKDKTRRFYPLYQLANIVLDGTVSDDEKGAAVGMVLTNMVCFYAGEYGGQSLRHKLLTDDKTRDFVSDILVCVGDFKNYYMAWRDTARLASYLGLVPDDLM